MRIALLDPPSFTVPYDHALASALARRGHDVTLLTAPFTHGDVPEPEGYRREEIFLPVSSRLVRRSPRSRARLVLKGLEYAPSAARLLRRVRTLDPDVAHVQWLAITRYDLHWLRRLGAPLVLTAHDVLPRRERNAAAWSEALALAARVIVQSERAVEQLAATGVPREKLVRIQHPVFESGIETTPPSGRTILFFGLIREYKGLDVLVRALADSRRALVVAGDPFDRSSRCSARGRARRRRPTSVAASASCPRRDCATRPKLRSWPCPTARSTAPVCLRPRSATDALQW
jgi:glycosyltransferase involved in cell wall biosynthesis